MLSKYLYQCYIQYYIKDNINSQSQIEMDKQKYIQEHGSYKAYFLMILSTLSFVLMELFFKELTKYFHPILTLSLRASLLCIFNMMLMKRFGLSAEVLNPQWVFRILVVRSIINFYAGALYMNSIKFIPIGVVNALSNTTPIITFFLEILYYRKGKLNWVNLLIIIICFSGILLIIQPEFLFGSKSTTDTPSSSNNIFYGMVLLGAFLSSFSAIFIHDLSGKVHELVTLHYGYLFQGLCSCMMFQLFFGNSDENANRFRNLPWLEIMTIVIYVIFMVLFAFAAHYLRTISFFMCYPALVLPFNYLTIIFGLIIDFLVFETKSYNFLIILGMILSGCGLFSKFLLLKFKLEN